MASSTWEAWVTRLKVSWMGIKAQRIFGAYGYVLGDMTEQWCMQGTLEHLPQYASDPVSIALHADDRQLDTYPGEPSAQLQAREPYWLVINKFRGRGLGLLLGLHFAGFDGAIIVQQNGIALSLTLPLPPFTGNWDPTPNLVITQCSQLATALTSNVTPPTWKTPGRSIPSATKWFFFDNNTDFCSRFAVLFPGPLPSYFIFGDTGRATFTASDSASLTWSNPLSVANYPIAVGPAVVTDGGGPVSVYADGSTETTTGVTIRASAPFTGYVDCAAVGGLNMADLQRLQGTIFKWRPAKATCTGVYALAQGQYWDWTPTRTWDGVGGTWDPSVVVSFQGA